MFLIALALAAAPKPTVADDARGFCRHDPRCVAEQLEAVHHFLGRAAMYDAPPAVEESCMRGGKVGRYVDWTIALGCIRAWTKDRPNVIEQSLKRP